jgi:hypothetical protein
VTRSERSAYVAEFARRFRERTPSTDILSALPEQRVGRSEMRAWFIEQFGRELTLDDATELDRPLKKTFAALRREFPEERW